MQGQVRRMVEGPVVRKQTHQVAIHHQDRTVLVGGGAPVVVQSMTNTLTADAGSTAAQVVQLADAGACHTGKAGWARLPCAFGGGFPL